MKVSELAFAWEFPPTISDQLFYVPWDKPPISFPPEITDNIIDCASSDKCTMAACSLVCRVWFPRSRHNLFMNVSPSVSTVEQSVLLLSHLDGEPICGCKFSSYIRHLRLKMPLETNGTEYGHTKALLTKLATLPLKRLGFWQEDCDYWFEDRLLKEITPILRTMDTLVDLTICNYLFCGGSEFSQLLSTFPHLRALHLLDLKFSSLPLGRRHNALTRAENTVPRPRISNALTELVIQTSFRSAWSGLSPLLDQQQHIRLSTLYVRISPVHGTDIPPAQQSFFASAIVSRLENLSLSLPGRNRRKLPNHTESNPGSLNDN